MKCLHIYADETGESHLADIDIPLVPVELFPGGSCRGAEFALAVHSLNDQGDLQCHGQVGEVFCAFL
jgi:hypothetical protein